MAGRYLAVAPAADLALPLTVRVRTGQVDVSATTVPALTTGAAETAVLGTKLGNRAPDSASTTWAPLGLGLLALLILAALAVPVLTTSGIGARLSSRPSAHRARRSQDYRRGDPEHEELRVDAWMARLCLLFLLPAGLAARFQLGDSGLRGQRSGRPSGSRPSSAASARGGCGGRRARRTRCGPGAQTPGVRASLLSHRSVSVCYLRFYSSHWAEMGFP